MVEISYTNEKNYDFLIVLFILNILYLLDII